jgi:HNH endonuclease
MRVDFRRRSVSMNRKGNEWEDVVPGVSAFTNAELDEKLEEAVGVHQSSEKLICCFLTELQDRRGYRDFGFSTIADYAQERFGFKERKTRYLVFLGRKVKELPELRDAVASGKLGWVKATRIASVASKEDETMWVDSALSLTTQELDRRIKDGTDRMSSMLNFFVTEDVRVLWENALEMARRAAGAEISTTEAFEYMVAEFIATWAEGGAPPEDVEEEDGKSGVQLEREPEPASESEDVETPGALFPFALPLSLPSEPGHDAASSAVERLFDGIRQPFDRAFRKLVLDRDQWQCSYPGCSARRELHVHHVEFRSQGGPNELSNCVTICAFHHGLLHAGQIAVRGRAPHHLEWTPPRLMREVLDRLRNRRLTWPGELEVREFPRDVDVEEALVSS